MDTLPISQITDLSSKIAIVTGGAMGIGFGIAYRLAEAGASVVIADVNEEEAGGAVKKLANQGFTATAITTDVSEEEQVSDMVRKTIEEYGQIDILVNNAGIFPNAPVLDMDRDTFEKILDINVKGVFLCSKLVSEKMVERGEGGRIINITSVDALHPSMVGLAAYDASKHGVWGFTKNLALELASHNIWVNAIAPGGIATPGTGAGGDVDQTMLEQFIQKIPMKRMGDPDEIGKVALFLASDLSSYMTGSQVVVDGGVLLS